MESLKAKFAEMTATPDMEEPVSDQPENVDMNEPTLDDEDEGVKQVRELKERAKEKFSAKEVDNFITMGKQLASKPVLSSLICLIKEGVAQGKPQKECDRLCKKVEAIMPYNYCGYTQCIFKEIPMPLNISLSLVDKGYKTDIDIPHQDYAKDLFSQYDFLKQTAIAYWRQFVEEHASLFKRICDYRNDIDLADLVADPENPTVLIWDAEQKKRVGLFAYYLDPKTGKPYYKRKTSSKK
jgi:hypothetical protein